MLARCARRHFACTARNRLKRPPTPPSAGRISIKDVSTKGDGVDIYKQHEHSSLPRRTSIRPLRIKDENELAEYVETYKKHGYNLHPKKDDPSIWIVTEIRNPVQLRNATNPRNLPHPLLPGIALAVVLGLATRMYLEQDRANDFIKYGLVHKKSVSPTASIFYLAQTDSSKGLEDYEDAWKKGIWNLEFKQPQIQVVRSYTPLPPIHADVDEGTPNHELRFLIRNEEHGEVSSWLHRLHVGSELELRGPKLEEEILPDTRHVMVLAGGTGIATALQAAHVLLSRPADPKDRPRISILWANRSRDECIGGNNYRRQGSPTVPEQGLIVTELEALRAAHPGQVTVDYFIDSEKTFIDKAAVNRAFSELEKDGSRSSKTQVIVSGPEGFIDYLAGPKEWRNGVHEQGPLNGVVAQVLQRSSHPIKVWKG